MKRVTRILLIFFILFNTEYCISFTRSNYDEASFEQFKTSKLNDQTLWEKDYYNYYEIWSSILFLPVTPVQALLNKENISDQTLLEILENMISDLKLRGLLEK